MQSRFSEHSEKWEYMKITGELKKKKKEGDRWAKDVPW